MVENIEFRDEAEPEQASGISIKEIILRQIRKIGDIASQELTGGYWQKKPLQTQSGILFSEIYHPDLREAYCNAIDFLVDIITPMADKELKAYIVDKETAEEEWTPDMIKMKVKHKRITFRKINEMFERTNFWKGTASYNE